MEMAVEPTGAATRPAPPEEVKVRHDYVQYINFGAE